MPYFVSKLRWKDTHTSVLFLLFFALFVTPLTASEFVGSEQCTDCHAKEVKEWQASHHKHSMEVATSESVLGDFSNSVIHYNGVDNRFYKKNGQFWLDVADEEGKLTAYQVTHTFAYKPLQQYLVTFEDGRKQFIPFAWDSRSKSEGGQRWFTLYPNANVQDQFHWQNAGQNWNYMCADCHSTNLKKNYDIEKDTYATSWSEISVGCEACHGPAHQHLTIANAEPKTFKGPWGFDSDLSKPVKEWVYQQGDTTLQPKAIHPTDQVSTCAQCHSRRIQLDDDVNHVKSSFFDRYQLDLLSSDLYYDDGQIFDEVFVYGSFLQSEMAEKGVVCTNCHNPHSGELNMPQEAVCSQCHLASEYTPEKHTFHELGTEGSQCVDCHMVETTYMQVDPRRDHAWHSPRPDISQVTGAPNACVNCHEDKDNPWAQEYINQWFPDSQRKVDDHYAAAFTAALDMRVFSNTTLSEVSNNPNLSDIVRASALERMAEQPSRENLQAIHTASKSHNEMRRLGVVKGVSNYSPETKWQILSGLLDDPVLAVRAEAAGELVPFWAQLNDSQRSQLQPALDDYLKIQNFNADRGFARTNIGVVYQAQGELDKAIQAYKGAISIEPYYENSYINLADLYRIQRNDQLSLDMLEAGLIAMPKSPSLAFSSGLAHLRLGQQSEAQARLRSAAQWSENNAHYWYVYGLSLEATSVQQAVNALSKAFQFSQDPRHLYAKCEVLARNKVQDKRALNHCLAELERAVPRS
ncbi:deca-heme c-type cytochrome [Vibrio sp. RE86]|uniref:multiheme c-type cytochrome n=1 Tax=Vibrio sp. RE86 TaxID=2607605 RepID=UPI00149349BF|nr:multiheme c-type cytochrome [Vibrio sp. RE86]NOH80210.1 deca-heme c-type cytochrome [Vibrio sp. RE86]